MTHRMGVREDQGVDLAEVLFRPPLDGARVERLAALASDQRQQSQHALVSLRRGYFSPFRPAHVNQDGLFLRGLSSRVADPEDGARVPPDVLAPERVGRPFESRPAAVATPFGRREARYRR